MIYQHIDHIIGNTPLLKISEHVTGLKHIDIYAKMEMFNIQALHQALSDRGSRFAIKAALTSNYDTITTNGTDVTP